LIQGILVLKDGDGCSIESWTTKTGIQLFKKTANWATDMTDSVSGISPLIAPRPTQNSRMITPATAQDQTAPARDCARAQTPDSTMWHSNALRPSDTIFSPTVRQNWHTAERVTA
jgi:hypothetical protein